MTKATDCHVALADTTDSGGGDDGDDDYDGSRYSRRCCCDYDNGDDDSNGHSSSCLSSLSSSSWQSFQPLCSWRTGKALSIRFFFDSPECASERAQEIQ